MPRLQLQPDFGSPGFNIQEPEFSDPLVGCRVWDPAEIPIEYFAEYQFIGSGVQEERNGGVQFLRITSTEDLVRGSALRSRNDGRAFDEPATKNGMCHVGPGFLQR